MLLLKWMAELASAIDVNVCVEGVETKEQLDILMGSKIQLIPGLLFWKTDDGERI